jgi:Glycosyl hydrolase family 52
VLLRTSSDGATRKLPPTKAISSRLGSVRVGLTPSSTLVEGSTNGLRLTYQVTRPYLRSNGVDDQASRITNSPLMYLRLVVRNTASSSRPVSAIYVGFGSSCGHPLEGSPRAGWRTLTMCNAGDAGGTRYLAVPSVAGSTWGTGPDTVSDFQAAGQLGGDGGSGNTAVALPVPKLSAGASYGLTLVYGAWNQAAGITAVDGTTRYPFYYLGWWGNAAAMLGSAIGNLGATMDGAASFDAAVHAVSTDTGAQYGAVHAFRGWRHDNWLVRRPDGSPFFAVSEGSFNYLSSVDVGYEYQPFQTRYEPWKSRLELDEWRDHYEADSAGHKFLLHDLGVGQQLTAGPAYDQKSGVRRHMPVEHNLDMVAMIFAWETRSGQSYDPTLVQQLLDAAESHDSDQNGSIDVSVMTACLPNGGRCRTSQLGTTYDGQVSEASKVQAGNTILTAKLGVVESFAFSRGYAPLSGADFMTRALRHLDRAKAFRDQLSSDSSLAGYDHEPGYLADALLYAAVLGSNPILDAAVPDWMNGALVANQDAVQGAYPSTAIAPNGTGETIVWISKALDGDAVGAWIRRTFPTLTTLRPEGPKLWTTWSKRSGGGSQGTFEFATYPSNAYSSAAWYPRAASLWATAPAT